jgi:hypothetical protein
MWVGQRPVRLYLELAVSALELQLLRAIHPHRMASGGIPREELKLVTHAFGRRYFEFLSS